MSHDGAAKIPEFGWIEDWLARGGQPDEEGYRWLAEHGIGIVVDVRTSEESIDVDKAAPQLQPVHIPVKDHHAPTDGEALQWLELCAQHAPDRAIYVHCKNGHGRTSTFCILTRLAMGWSLDRAIAEQERFNYQPDGERLQVEYLENFARRMASGELTVPRI